MENNLMQEITDIQQIPPARDSDLQIHDLK